MKFGVISDVHGNLVALEAALAALEAQGVERVICCGDVVGYGPWPNECVALVRERCACCVSGNHDGAAVGTVDLSHFSGPAALALRWTRERLTPESLAFLRARPLQTTYEDFLVTHGSPRDPIWEYLTDRLSAYVNFHHFEGALCWFGHSHLPTLFAEHGGDVQGGRIVDEPAVELDPGKRYLINPGSVGQPRDGDWRLAFAVYEVEGRRVSFHRLAYDVERTVEAMRAANLPAPLYNRLLLGR